MLTVGQCVTCVTKTRNDTFGTVTYEVVAVNLPCGKKGCGKDDAIRFIMLGGTGPAARKGITLQECKSHVEQLMKEGKVRVVPGSVKTHYENAKKNERPGKVIELD